MITSFTIVKFLLKNSKLPIIYHCLIFSNNTTSSHLLFVEYGAIGHYGSAAAYLNDSSHTFLRCHQWVIWDFSFQLAMRYHEPSPGEPVFSFTTSIVRGRSG